MAVACSLARRLNAAGHVYVRIVTRVESLKLALNYVGVIAGVGPCFHKRMETSSNTVTPRALVKDGEVVYDPSMSSHFSIDPSGRIGSGQAGDASPLVRDP